VHLLGTPPPSYTTVEKDLLERGAGEFILREDFERRVCDGVEGTSDGWGWDLRDGVLVLQAVCGVGGSGRRE
jgi:hypothetical protein